MSKPIITMANVHLPNDLQVEVRINHLGMADTYCLDIHDTVNLFFQSWQQLLDFQQTLADAIDEQQYNDPTPTNKEPK